MVLKNASRKEVDVKTIHQTSILPLAVDALQYLVLALRDPLQPTECGDALYGAMKQLGPLENVQISKEGPGLFSATQRLWTTLYQFLVTPRTDEQLDNMMKKLTVCSCSYDLGVGLSGKFHRVYHNIREHREYIAKNCPLPIPAVDDDYSASACIEGTYTTFFLIHVFGTLRKVLHPGHGPGHVSVTLIRKGQSKRWPNQLSDLMPFGPDELIKSFMQWNRFLDDPCVLKTAIPILTTCGALVQPSVAELDLSHNMVFEPIKRYLDENLEVLLTGARSIRPPSPWREMIWRVCDFCSYITWVQSPGDVAINQFYHGREVEALQLCSIFCYLLEFVTEQQSHNPQASFTQEMSVKSAHLGRSILRDVCADGPVHIDIPLHPHITAHHMHRSEVPPIDSDERPGNIVSFAMVRSRIHLGCAAAGCQKSLLHVGSNFKLCQGCLTLGYCGSECRVQDWKDSDLPHKVICPIISRILKCFGGWPNFRERGTSDLNAVPPETHAVVKLANVIEEMINDGSLPTDELGIMRRWSTRLVKSWMPVAPAAAPVPPTHQVRGYENYEAILGKLTGRSGFRGPRPSRMNDDKTKET